MSSEQDEAREEFLGYRRDAAHDSLAAKRWWYWSTLARVRSMQQADRPWEEIAHLLDLNPADRLKWGVRQGDRRVKVMQQILAEEADRS